MFMIEKTAMIFFFLFGLTDFTWFSLSIWPVMCDVYRNIILGMLLLLDVRKATLSCNYKVRQALLLTRGRNAGRIFMSPRCMYAR